MSTETPTVGLIVDVTVTVIHPDTSASVTITASSDPSHEVSVAALLDGALGGLTTELVDRITPSVCAQADTMLEGQ